MAARFTIRQMGDVWVVATINRRLADAVGAVKGVGAALGEMDPHDDEVP